MLIDFIQVQNYRSIEDEKLNCGELTALVGRNGSGKSSFLRALELFYNLTPKIDIEDFYNRDVDREIIISVTFKDLPPNAKTLFDKYIQNDTLTVQRVISLKEGALRIAYHGATLQNPAFKPLREALELSDRGATAKVCLGELKAREEYADIQNWSTKAAVSENLKAWEAAHPERCTREKDDGQFFGFKTVGNGYLGRFTRFLFIPAVRDAAQDALDGPSSPITELMNLVVRSILASKPELAELKVKTQSQFSDLMTPAKLTELNDLAQKMTGTLQNFVPEASIEMVWQKLAEIDFPLPKAETKLTQDGYSSPVNRAGHGLQRAFIITALQHLAFAQQTSPATQPDTEHILPVLVLAIEEPELYQHPNSQHHLAKILFDIAKGRTPGVAEKTQVIYGTHSPQFVGIDRINQIRLLRKKHSGPGKPKISCVVETNLDKLAELLWDLHGQKGTKFTSTTLQPRLHSIMTTTMNEGFFADVVVLVEGEDDVAALHGVAQSLGHDFASMGISLIACNGKNCIDRPTLIFRELGIPTYIVWDSDKGEKDANPEENHVLLKLVNSPVEDFPPTQVSNLYGCFEVDLETTMKEEIGKTEYELYLQQAQTKFGIPKKHQALKNPMVVAEIVNSARSNGHTSPTLERIVTSIVRMK